MNIPVCINMGPVYISLLPSYLIGYTTSIDVCSLCYGGQLVTFSAAAMNFGIKQDPTTPLGREYQWIGHKSLFDSSALKSVWKNK